MNADPGIVAWTGLQGWQGEALPEYRNFDFADIPWIALRREGRRIGDFECVKSSNSRRVLRYTPESGPPLYVKRYLVNNWRRRIGVRILGTRAGREFHLGHQLLRAGIATPDPLAWAAHAGVFRIPYRNRHVAIPTASYLLTLEWPNQGSVREWLEANPQREPGFIRGLAAFLAAAHDQGFYHDDCAADHVLVASPENQPEPSALSRFAFIDVDNGRMRASSLSARLRFVNLFQILRSISFTIFNEEERREFLAGYLASAGAAFDLTLEDCIERVERVAHRKISRSVMRA